MKVTIQNQIITFFCDKSFTKGVCVSQPSALGSQNIAQLNTILLFNFELAITLKL